MHGDDRHQPELLRDLRRHPQHVGKQTRVEIGGLLRRERRAQAGLDFARPRQLRQDDEGPAAALQDARDRGATNGRGDTRAARPSTSSSVPGAACARRT